MARDRERRRGPWHQHHIAAGPVKGTRRLRDSQASGLGRDAARDPLKGRGRDAFPQA